MSRAALVSLLLSLALAPPAAARTAAQPWPPATGPGQLFIHFGEEHIRDADGPTLLPKVAAEAARYKPALVTTSGDKATDGQEDQFADWDKAMKALDDAGVRYLAGVGNHDRTSPPGAPAGTVGLFELTTSDSFDTYRAHFAKRPYPWGDGAPYAGIEPARPSDDPAGAASLYYADIGNVRWIFLDNSCWSLSGCDGFALHADGGSESQLDYLRAKAGAATKAGKVVFVVMHIPTEDPRDQSYTDTTAQNHIMGKGLSPLRAGDNAAFEEAAEQSGVDGVFVGHIKGQFLYKGRGGIPYFIDGGAGGELYTTGPVGTDHGYWHGFRLVRVDGDKIRTDTVPIFVPDGIRIEGPDSVARGQTAQFQAFGKQPVFKDPAKVENLELRDPAPKPRSGGLRLGLLVWLLPLGLTGLFAFVVSRARLLQRGPRAALGACAAFVAVSGASAVAVAQQDQPTSTPKDSLPVPARVWSTGDARVLAPLAAENDDDRRDPRRQTTGGRFAATCPGRTTITVTSGFEASDRAVTVPAQAGRLVRSITRGARSVRRGAFVRVARVAPAQPVVTRVRVKRAKKVVAELLHSCSGKPQIARWSTRGAKRGAYTVEVRVTSDRKPIVRRYAVRVR